ncbi:MAG: hypothetical protein AAGI15_04735 [Pseudomonadota bacterium]
MSLVARKLEAHGIATVIAGSALDIVTHAGVPRFLFNDFPLGNPIGKPFDRVMQRAVVRQSLELLAQAKGPATHWQTPFEWSADESWRAVYARVDASNRERLKALGDERRARQAAKKR